MTQTPKGAKKFASKKLAEDPDYFKKLRAKAKKPTGGKHSSGSFKKGQSTAAQLKGGKTGKRGPAKVPTKMGQVCSKYKLEYEEMK